MEDSVGVFQLLGVIATPKMKAVLPGLYAVDCNKCGLRNHFARVCKSKKVRKVVESSESNTDNDSCYCKKDCEKAQSCNS